MFDLHKLIVVDYVMWNFKGKNVRLSRSEENYPRAKHQCTPKNTIKNLKRCRRATAYFKVY